VHPLTQQVHPESEQESIFRTFFAVRRKSGASISSCRPSFEGKKGRQLLGEKSAPQTKSWLRLWLKSSLFGSYPYSVRVFFALQVTTEYVGQFTHGTIGGSKRGQSGHGPHQGREGIWPPNVKSWIRQCTAHSLFWIESKTNSVQMCETDRTESSHLCT